jgi:hypothetical protein
MRTLADLVAPVAFGILVITFYKAVADVARAIREVADAVRNIWSCTCSSDGDDGDEDEIDNTAPPAAAKPTKPELLS